MRGAFWGEVGLRSCCLSEIVSRVRHTDTTTAEIDLMSRSESQFVPRLDISDPVIAHPSTATYTVSVQKDATIIYGAK